MRVAPICLLAALTAFASTAGERVSGENHGSSKERAWRFSDHRSFWVSESYGMATIKEGPLSDEPFECHGSGFSGATYNRGDGICVFGVAPDAYVWKWTASEGRANDWEIIDATGKYQGMTGSGVVASRPVANQQPMAQRVHIWSGEIDLPE